MNHEPNIPKRLPSPETTIPVPQTLVIDAGGPRARPRTPRGCGPGCPQVGCAGASRSDRRGPRTPSQGPRARGAGRCVCLSAAPAPGHAAPASRICGRQGSAPRPSPQLGAAPGVRTASGSFRLSRRSLAGRLSGPSSSPWQEEAIKPRALSAVVT